MVRTQNAFIGYLKVVLSEDSPNYAWAVNNVSYVRQAAGIGSDEILNFGQLIARLDAVTDEQDFIENLLEKTPREFLMAYTPDIWAKAFESDSFRVNDLSVGAKRRLRNCVSLRLTDLTGELGLSDYWAITASAGNYQSMINALPHKSRYKYQIALDECIRQVAGQIDVERYGGSLEGLKQKLCDPEYYEKFKDKLTEQGFLHFLTPQAQQNMRAENAAVHENLMFNGVAEEDIQALAEQQNLQYSETILKVATGQEKSTELPENVKSPLRRMTNIVRNTAAAIKADPVTFAKTFAHGAVKSAVINAAISTGSLPLVGLAVTGVTAVYARNQYRTMQQELYKDKLAKTLYHVNSWKELSTTQLQKFQELCEKPNLQAQINDESKNMRLTGELTKQLLVKTATELGSNILMAVPAGKLVLSSVLTGSQAAVNFLASTVKNLTASTLQGLKYYQSQIFQARNHGANEREIKAHRASYLRNAIDKASIGLLSRTFTDSLRIVANDVKFSDATLMERFQDSTVVQDITDFRRTSILDKIPFLNNLRNHQTTLQEIQTQNAGKMPMPEPTETEWEDVATMETENVIPVAQMGAELER